MLRLSRKALCIAGCALTVTLVSACTPEQPAPRALHTSSITAYRLDSGDRLRITVFDQTGLTGTYNVDQAGYISFPLIGAVPVRGKTVSQVEKRIAAKLANGFVKNPDVSVQVDQYRSIYVMGEVGQAGQYSYVPGMTAEKAVAAAGGFSPRANEQTVKITRDINGKPVTGNIPLTDPIMAGDTIYVRERIF